MGDAARPAPLGKALAVWACGMLAYVMAVAGRTSMGVAGLAALDRFHIGPSTLAVFTGLQLLVYGLAQVPVGLVLDRIGSRRMLATGALLLALGQAWLALTGSLPGALAARVLVGLGDATAFISVLRLLPKWFSPRQLPLLTQLTAVLGFFGQAVSALPFFSIMRHWGWPTAFLSLAGMGAIVALLVYLGVRDAPQGGAASTSIEKTSLRRSLSLVVRDPGCWAGMFCHYLGFTPYAVYAMLWGVPLLTSGMGVSSEKAGATLLIAAAGQITMGTLYGTFATRFPHRGVQIVYFAGVCSVSAWAMLLLPEQGVPYWLACVCAALLGMAAPSTNAGFEFIRGRIEGSIAGTASGFVNMGGFLACMVALQIIGSILEIYPANERYTLVAMRPALASIIIVWGIGVLGFLIARRKYTLKFGPVGKNRLRDMTQLINVANDTTERKMP